MMKKNIKSRSIRKRSFLLFEVLLSLTLLIAIFFPMLKTQFSLMQEEVKVIERMAFERLKEVAFSEIKEFLYENRVHSFLELQNGVFGQLADTTFKSKQYQRKYEIVPLEYCYKKSTNDKYLLVEVILKFESQGKEKGCYKSTYLIVN